MSFHISDAFHSPIFLSENQLALGSGALLGLSFAIGGICLIYVTLVLLMKKSAAEKVKESNNAELFVRNVQDLSLSLFFPNILPSKRWFVLGKLASVCWMILFLISIIVLQTGLSTIGTLQFVNVDRNDKQIQAGLVLYFLALIGYFITRTMSYYKDKLEVRKKSRGLTRSSLTQPDLRMQDVFAEDTVEFDDNFNYRRRLKHITPIFYSVQPTIFNGIQILVLLTEFIQLASFPVRDLFRSASFLESLAQPQGSSIKYFISSLHALLASLSTGMISSNYNYIKFAVLFWLTAFAFFIAIFFTFFYWVSEMERVSDWLSPSSRKAIATFIKGRWIVLLLPLINLFYLVILNAFIDPLSCLSSNTTPTWPVAFEDQAIAAQARLYQCVPIYIGAPSMNTWYALTAFTVAFFLFTICRISQDPIPVDGTITYTSKSELWLKMSSISLLLIYALIPTQETAMGRGLMALFLLIFMTLYNVIIGSTHIRWVNSARSLSFLSTLWMCSVTSYYTSDSNRLLLFYTGAGVFATIGLGWIVIWILYFLLDYFVILPWEKECIASTDDSSSTSSDNHSVPSIVTEDRNRDDKDLQVLPRSALISNSLDGSGNSAPVSGIRHQPSRSSMTSYSSYASGVSVTLAGTKSRPLPQPPISELTITEVTYIHHRLEEEFLSVRESTARSKRLSGSRPLPDFSK
jgi:hypothetical protein